MSTTTADRISAEYTVDPTEAEVLAEIDRQLEELAIQNWPFAKTVLADQDQAIITFAVKVQRGKPHKIQSAIRISKGAFKDKREGYSADPDQNTLPLK